jgi:methyl-accepting chemotaxis protein
MGMMESHIRDLALEDATLMGNSIRARATINMMRRFEKDLFLNISNAEKMAEYKKKWDEASSAMSEAVDKSLKILETSEDEHAKDSREKLLALKKTPGSLQGWF